jgi:hypothetical protein
MQDYSKTEGVPNRPLPRLKRLELNFFHAKMDSLTWKSIVVPINSGPPQAKGTGESNGLLCKDYRDTLSSSFQCFPHQHYW